VPTQKKPADQADEAKRPRADKKSSQKLIDVLGSSPESKRARVTFLMPSVLDRNLEMFCLSRGLKKSDVAELAFIKYLTDAGMSDPAKDRSEGLDDLVTKGKIN
jgi:hypothetical protein